MWKDKDTYIDFFFPLGGGGGDVCQFSYLDTAMMMTETLDLITTKLPPPTSTKKAFIVSRKVMYNCIKKIYIDKYISLQELSVLPMV